MYLEIFTTIVEKKEKREGCNFLFTIPIGFLILENAPRFSGRTY